MRDAVRVAVLPGDGIGVEVTEATLTVLRAVDARHGLGLSFEGHRVGAFAYRDTGSELSDETFAACRSADAILLGACGWPGIRRADGTELAPQITLRQRLGLFAGVRPIRAIPGVKLPLADPRAAEIDLVILRESTEGLFFSKDSGPRIRASSRRTTRRRRCASRGPSARAWRDLRSGSRRRGRSGG